MHSLVTTLLATAALAGFAGAAPNEKQLTAMVWRSPPITCQGCPEAVGRLLRASSQKFKVIYVGPNEKVKVTPKTLGEVDLFAYGGGPDVTAAWNELKDVGSAIRDFVADGGHYLGICLGAYLTDNKPGLGMLPDGVEVKSEKDQPGAQVTDDRDTVIQVNWTFQFDSKNSKQGQTISDRWVYFQEGASFAGLSNITSNNQTTIVSQYSKTGNVAATLLPYRKGWVALSGIHPEASKSWYDSAKVKNPDGIKFDIAFDLVDAAVGTSKGTPGNDPDDSIGTRLAQPPLGLLLTVVVAYLLI